METRGRDTLEPPEENLGSFCRVRSYGERGFRVRSQRVRVVLAIIGLGFRV